MKKIFESRKVKNMLFIFLGIIIGGTTIGTFSYAIADNILEAKQVSYSNTKSEENVGDVQEAIDELYARSTRNLLDRIYPVGCIYTSVNPTSPADLFGGTWVEFGAGRTLVGVDTSQTEFNVVKKQGGDKTVTLLLTQIPSHNHAQHILVDGHGSTSGGADYDKDTSTGGTYYQLIDTGYAGGDASGNTVPHDNLQPYITVYMWERVNDPN